MSSPPPDARACKHCGQTLREDAPGGICHACLLSEALATNGAIDEVETVFTEEGESVHPPRRRKADPLEGTSLGPGGRYKILQAIGEGGFGTVYMAEQSAPVKRRVAIKILKTGMDTRQVVARFEAERQALAMMDHPNIAKVLDGGESEQGRPFFVMELVRGTPLTTFCDREALSTRKRLDLFLKVCRAVQHAHQKGIIHRDLKPGNILITMPDGAEPVPKVIDFGVAKAMESNLTDKTLFTRFEQMIGTPAYMSPEQAGTEGTHDIDTRADIYALGILLYELLTGTTPFESATLQRAAFDEVRRILREEEAPRPSARLGSLELDRRTTIAKSRSTESSSLGKQLRGDLDWIVMKAIEKDRRRRYDTANALAADVERHLEDEPVSAGPPTAAYRTGKFLRRHKAPLAVAATVVTLLIAGIVATGWQAVRATGEKKRALEAEELAEERLAEAEAISDFITGMFESAQPGAEEGGRTITVADSLKIAERKLEEDDDMPAERLAVLRQAVAQVYNSLGRYDDAIAVQELVRDFYLEKHGFDHEGTLEVCTFLAFLYSNGRRDDEALELREEVLTRCRRILGPEHPETLDAAESVAISYVGAGRRGEAVAMLEQTLALNRGVHGPKHKSTVTNMVNLARAYMAKEEGEKALVMAEEAFKLCGEIHGPEHPTTLSAMEAFADALFQMARKTEAMAIQEDLLRLSRKVLGSEHPDTMGRINNLAHRYWWAHQKDEALELQQEVVDLSRRMQGAEHPDTLRAMASLAEFFQRSGRREEALATREDVLQVSRRESGTDHPQTLAAMNLVAVSCLHAKRFDRAREMLEELLPLRTRVSGAEHPDTITVLHNLAVAHSELDGNDEAVELQEKVLAARLRSHGPDHQDTHGARGRLSKYYEKVGRLEEALELAGFGYLPVRSDSPAVTAVLIDPASDWRWLHSADGIDPAESDPDFQQTFFRMDYDDSFWQTGKDSGETRGGFGYGDDWFEGVDIGLPGVADENGKRNGKSAYFRHRFTTDREHFQLELRCQRDDGLIVYLDGKEVARENMMEGDESYDLPAEKAVGGLAETIVFRIPFEGVSLPPGKHVLAISLHNTKAPSSDLRIGEISLVEVE